MQQKLKRKYNKSNLLENNLRTCEKQLTLNNFLNIPTKNESYTETSSSELSPNKKTMQIRSHNKQSIVKNEREISTEIGLSGYQDSQTFSRFIENHFGNFFFLNNYRTTYKSN